MPILKVSFLQANGNLKCLLCSFLPSLFILACGTLAFTQGQPKPPKGTSFANLPRLDSSVIEVPISLSLEALQTYLNQEFPRTFEAGENPGCNTDTWATIERGDVSLNITGSTVHWDLPLNVRVYARLAEKVFGQCIRTTEHCDMGFVVPVRTTLQITNDWRLLSETRRESLRWTKPCKVNLGIKIDVTDLLEGEVEDTLDSYGPEIDRQIAQEFDLRALLQEAWQELQNPVMLAEDTWLLLTPENLYLSDLQGINDKAHITLGLETKSRLLIGNPPNLTSYISLPSKKSTSIGNSFKLFLEGSISYKEATTQANSYLADTSYTFDNKTFTIDEVEIYGTGKDLVVKLNLKGDFHGTLYLTGQPTYDVNRQEVFVRNLDYHIETRNLILRVADWLNHEGFQSSLQDTLRWQLTQDLAEAHALAEEALNQSLEEGLHLSGEFTSLQPEGIYLTPAALLVRVYTTGQVSLGINDF